MSEIAERIGATPPPGKMASPIFNWRKQRGRRVRLAMFFTAALALHALLFYLFQVVYPPSRRLVRQPAGITVLSSQNPGSVELLNEIAERTPAFEGGLSEGATLLAAEENFVADYVATYHNYHPELLSPSSSILPKPLPPLATPGAVTLPEIPARSRMLISVEPLAPEQLIATLILAEEKPGNWILPKPHQVVAPPKMLKALADLPSSPRLRVGLNKQGKIIFVGMISLISSELEGPLRAAAYASNFQPTAAAIDPVATVEDSPPLAPAIEFLDLVIHWTHSKRQ